MKKNPGIASLILFLSFFAAAGVLFTACNSDESNSNVMETAKDKQLEEGTIDTAVTEKQVFNATLESSNEVPEVDSNAKGNVVVTLSKDSIYVEGQFSNLGSEYTASHIHMGAEGSNGDPVQTLQPQLDEEKTSGSWVGSYKVDSAITDALKAGRLYVNVHSTEHKAGEIRGQLTTGDSMDN